MSLQGSSGAPPTARQERLLQASLVLAAVIHVLPSPGVLGRGRLADLYGIDIEGPDVELLLRHRAVLFLLLGALLLLAAFVNAYRSAAIGMSLVSAGAFVVIALATPDRNTELDRVLVADLVAAAALLLAWALHARQDSHPTRPRR